MAISKESTFFVQSSWNLVKMIISWGYHFHQVSWEYDKNCGFLAIGQFLNVDPIFDPDFSYLVVMVLIYFDPSILACLFSSWIPYRLLVVLLSKRWLVSFTILTILLYLLVDVCYAFECFMDICCKAKILDSICKRKTLWNTWPQASASHFIWKNSC